MKNRNREEADGFIASDELGRIVVYLSMNRQLSTLPEVLAEQFDMTPEDVCDFIGSKFAQIVKVDGIIRDQGLDKVNERISKIEKKAGHMLE